MALAIVVTLLLTASVSLLLWWWLVDRPVRDLIQILAEAPSKDFLVRAPVRGGGAIGRLTQSFNRLLERITTLDAFKLETERQLVMAQQELKYKEALEEKTRVIEKTNQDLQARLNELRLLNEFSERVSRTLEEDELYNIVEKFIAENLGFHEFALLVYEEREHRLVVRVACGFRDENRVLGMTFGSEEGVTGRVLVTGQTVYLPDTRQAPDYLYFKGEKREDGSFLAIPLILQKKVVGVLNMFRGGEGRFSTAEIQFLNTMTVELAIAIVNAKLYSRTRELSVRDELTQLYNRRHFQETLPLEIKRSQRFKKPFSLLMMDIDHFKAFNDRYGHLAGDECLKEFVYVVNSRIREVDFFARFGGEEFVLILPNTPKEDGMIVGEKIAQLVRGHSFGGAASPDAPKPPKSSFGPAKPDPHERLLGERLTVSIGVASYPDDARMMEDLIDAADAALYEAKGKGRDRVASYLSAPLPDVRPSV